jgi:hypothetical protein
MRRKRSLRLNDEPSAFSCCRVDRTFHFFEVTAQHAPFFIIGIAVQRLLYRSDGLFGRKGQSEYETSFIQADVSGDQLRSSFTQIGPHLQIAGSEGVDSKQNAQRHVVPLEKGAPYCATQDVPHAVARRFCGRYARRRPGPAVRKA